MNKLLILLIISILYIQLYQGVNGQKTYTFNNATDCSKGCNFFDVTLWNGGIAPVAGDQVNDTVVLVAAQGQLVTIGQSFGIMTMIISGGVTVVVNQTVLTVHDAITVDSATLVIDGQSNINAKYVALSGTALYSLIGGSSALHTTTSAIDAGTELRLDNSSSIQCHGLAMFIGIINVIDTSSKVLFDGYNNVFTNTINSKALLDKEGSGGFVVGQATFNSVSSISNIASLTITISLEVTNGAKLIITTSSISVPPATGQDPTVVLYGASTLQVTGASLATDIVVLKGMSSDPSSVISFSSLASVKLGWATLSTVQFDTVSQISLGTGNENNVFSNVSVAGVSTLGLTNATLDLLTQSQSLVNPNQPNALNITTYRYNTIVSTPVTLANTSLNMIKISFLDIGTNFSIDGIVTLNPITQLNVNDASLVCTSLQLLESSAQLYLDYGKVHCADITVIDGFVTVTSAIIYGSLYIQSGVLSIIFDEHVPVPLAVTTNVVFGSSDATLRINNPTPQIPAISAIGDITVQGAALSVLFENDVQQADYTFLSGSNLTGQFGSVLVDHNQTLLKFSYNLYSTPNKIILDILNAETNCSSEPEANVKKYVIIMSATGGAFVVLVISAILFYRYKLRNGGGYTPIVSK